MPLALLLVAIVVAVSGFFIYRDATSDVPLVPTPVEDVAADNGSAPIVASSVYADGSYTKTGTYTSPAGTETVVISLTIEDDKVIDATFTGKATNPGSIQNQAKFSAGFEGQVVGKPIDSIALTVVNGSSLTPKGFMDALSQIKTAARN